MSFQNFFLEESRTSEQRINNGDSQSGHTFDAKNSLLVGITTEFAIDPSAIGHPKSRKTGDCGTQFLRLLAWVQEYETNSARLPCGWCLTILCGDGHPEEMPNIVGMNYPLNRDELFKELLDLLEN